MDKKTILKFSRLHSPLSLSFLLMPPVYSLIHRSRWKSQLATCRSHFYSLFCASFHIFLIFLSCFTRDPLVNWTVAVYDRVNGCQARVHEQVVQLASDRAREMKKRSFRDDSPRWHTHEPQFSTPVYPNRKQPRDFAPRCTGFKGPGNRGKKNGSGSGRDIARLVS